MGVDKVVQSVTSIEQLRQAFRPPDVRVLFVGESPPANGTFFYLASSSLWRYTYQAFRNVYRDDLDRDSGFCRFFMSKGCYLDDLCLAPVNRMQEAQRRRACDAAVESLAERIRVLSPQTVVCVKRSISRQVESAMAKVRLQDVPLHGLPFPSCGHQQEYVEGLIRLMVKLRTCGVMD